MHATTSEYYVLDNHRTHLKKVLVPENEKENIIKNWRPKPIERFTFTLHIQIKFVTWTVLFIFGLLTPAK